MAIGQEIKSLTLDALGASAYSWAKERKIPKGLGIQLAAGEIFFPANCRRAREFQPTPTNQTMIKDIGSLLIPVLLARIAGDAMESQTVIFVATAVGKIATNAIIHAELRKS